MSPDVGERHISIYNSICLTSYSTLFLIAKFWQNLLSLKCMISVFRILEYIGLNLLCFLQDEDQESVFMPNKNGKNYLCYLPKVEKSKSGKPSIQVNMSSMIVESEKRVKLKTPDELLEALKEQCFVRVRIYCWI